MYRKQMFLACFSLVLGLFLSSQARAADPDLVAHWKLDDGAGTTAIDSSGNGNDGTFVGAPKWAAGKLGGALDFDGNDDYVDCGNDAIFGITDAFSLTIWINWRAAGATWQTVIAKGDNTWRLARGDTTQTMDFGFTDGGPRGWLAARTASSVPFNEWHHVAATIDKTEGAKIYLDGVLEGTNPDRGGITVGSVNYPVRLGENAQATGRFWNGLLDDARVYKRVLSQAEIQAVMEGAGADYPFASGPSPADGALHPDTWVTLSWRAGDFAVSHDVYLGDNRDDVNNGTGDTFRGNQTSTYYVAGFPGFAYPDGLVPGTTYYWRIDEVNNADPNSPWKGPVWSFSIPPRKAYNPVPADGTESVAVNAKLTWTAGFGAKLHTVYLGDSFETVANAAGGLPQGTTTYTPSALKMARTYYWRVDEFDGTVTHKGDVWSFTTQGAIGNPNPANGAVDVKPTAILTWRAGALAASHEVYFGTDADAVKNATKASPEYKGPKALGDESYAPGTLKLLTAYYWRIDEVNTVNPDSPWKGNLWSFTTGDFFVVDDFEDYDAGDNQIWYSWHDGLGYGIPGTPGFFGGNGTGSAVGDENTASFTEETIVHGGGQSMPVAYNNNKQGAAKYSEVELKLTAPRDWTEEGVGEISIWFRGLPGSVGSFVEAPAGTYTMTASGTDIWNVGTAGNYHDEFHFAYKTLTGAGSIVARVQSVQNTNAWSKAGVMIRETLDGGSKHAFACVTPSNGVASQGRALTGDSSINTNQTGVTAPHWVKLERDFAGNFTVSHSANGTTWQPVTGATPQNIQMASTVYIGLALTSHDAAQTCQAVFTNVTTTGTVSPQWAHQDIGIASNAPEPLYVAVSNAAGQPAVVVHPDPAAAQITTWTEWVVPLSAFADKGINLTNVDRIALGLGTRGNTTTPGDSGKMYFDDIRLYRPRTP